MQGQFVGQNEWKIYIGKILAREIDQIPSGLYPKSFQKLLKSSSDFFWLSSDSSLLETKGLVINDVKPDTKLSRALINTSTL